jgi:hypothetical protein
MNQIVDIATLVLIVAAITVLVRPSSQGPALVGDIFKGFSGLVGAATTF